MQKYIKLSPFTKAQREQLRNEYSLPSAKIGMQWYVSLYEEQIIRKLLLQIKQLGKYDLYHRFIEPCCQLPQHFTMVVPIPSSMNKKQQFGGHAEHIAEQLALHIGTYSNVLTVQEHSTEQKYKTAKERKSLLDEKFHLSRSVDGAEILLVDDICTTGATLASATRLLLARGASSVSWLTLSYTPLHKYHRST